jgi:ATP-dependent DNA helicase RecQ
LGVTSELCTTLRRRDGKDTDRMSHTRTAEQEAAWQGVRRVVLARDRNRCQDCGEAPDRRELDVHHLVRRADGGRDEASNCVTLCDGCHAARHPRLQVALSRRMMERWALRLVAWLDRTGELPDETRALAALRLFGADRFRDGQLDAVLGALRGESLLVIRPTGAGKSLCFQLPAVLKGQPTTLVLSPLKALMVDQVTGLQRNRLNATFINADISRDEKEQRYRLLERGALNLLYVAPERFNPQRANPAEVERLCRLRPSFLVVDEAHLVDRWGDDFRTDYSRIAEIRRRLGDPPVLAFTATAGVRTQQRIKDSLGVPRARTLMSGVDRPNITLVRIQEHSTQTRARIVAQLLENLEHGRAMLFVPTVKIGLQVQEALRDLGCELPLYHSKLPADERDQILGRFTAALAPPLKAVICTSAFSMGLDISDVRAVINWQHPSAVEDYLQEFGRGGRDGEPALALLFGDQGRERGLLRWMAEKTTAEAVKQGTRSPEEAQQTLRAKHERIEEIAALARQEHRCFRAALHEALAGPVKAQRRSLALRILERVFASRSRVRASDRCCDVCNPELVDELRAGAYAPDAQRARRRGRRRRRRVRA